MEKHRAPNPNCLPSSPPAAMSSPRSRRGILTTIPVSGDGTFGYSVPPPAHCSSAAATLLPFVGLSGVELAVQKCLYWPDGRRKKHLASQPIDTTRDSNRQLVEALVDKYNEDHNLLGDLAYEFKDIMCCQSIRDSRFYDHINFTAKVKGADDLNCCTDKLFFAEVMYNQSSSELFVICLCVLDPTANGYCYGCHCNGSPDMKHPSSGYMAGHTSNVSGRPSKINCGKFDDEDNEDELEAQKARLRWLFGGSELKQIRDPHGAER